jgi:hypothetical protein
LEAAGHFTPPVAQAENGAKTPRRLAEPVAEPTGVPGFKSLGGAGVPGVGQEGVLAPGLDGGRQKAYDVIVFRSGNVSRSDVRARVPSEPHGNGGFGCDPVFAPEGMDRTFAQLSIDEKNAISHRGRAVVAAAQRIGEFLSQCGIQ